MFRSILFAAMALVSAPLLAQKADPAVKALPRSVFTTSMEAQFARVDANKDGQLSRSEIEAAETREAIEIAQLRAKSLFTQLDADKNGSLSPAEFGKLAGAPPQVNPDAVLRFDTDKNGTVSAAEYRAATLANFDRMDKNKDGTVSIDELKSGSEGR